VGNPVCIVAIGTIFYKCRNKCKEKKNTFVLVMVMRKMFHRIVLLLLMVVVLSGNGAEAQILPVLNSFRNRTFTGTVDVSWPVEFEGCTFITDSVVLRHSYGAVFSNCTFESQNGVLYMAGDGDGIILSDCDVKGCKELRFSRMPSLADRNYINGVRLNGVECSVLDEQTGIIDIDGLELAECVSGKSDGPMIMIITADKSVLRKDEIVYLQIRGLEKGMFVGWLSSDSDLKLTVDNDGLGCRVYAFKVKGIKRAVISAYTEYGLEAAYEITVSE